MAAIALLEFLERAGASSELRTTRHGTLGNWELSAAHLSHLARTESLVGNTKVGCERQPDIGAFVLFELAVAGRTFAGLDQGCGPSRVDSGCEPRADVATARSVAGCSVVYCRVACDWVFGVCARCLTRAAREWRDRAVELVATSIDQSGTQLLSGVVVFFRESSCSVAGTSASCIRHRDADSGSADPSRLVGFGSVLRLLRKPGETREAMRSVGDEPAVMRPRELFVLAGSSLLSSQGEGGASHGRRAHESVRLCVSRLVLVQFTGREACVATHTQPQAVGLPIVLRLEARLRVCPAGSGGDLSSIMLARQLMGARWTCSVGLVNLTVIRGDGAATCLW